MMFSRSSSGVSYKLWELHNDYSLAPDKIEIKREMLSHHQLKIADHYNVPIGNVKKLVPNFSDKYKYVIHYDNLHIYLKTHSKVWDNFWILKAL